MKGIVLTFDKYSFIAEHMILCYQELWPHNPFTFRLPYQAFPTMLQEKFGQKIELVPSPKNIKQTLLTLLSDLEDEEWIFWCMDDRYPIRINIEKLSFFYESVSRMDIDGLSFLLSMKDYSIRYRYIMKYKINDNKGNIYYRKKQYGSIWSHQFIKVKVLRYFFEQMPDEMKSAKEMDHYLLNQSVLPKAFKLYVTSKSHGLYGESTTRGKLTENCFDSLRKFGLSVPDYFETTGKRIIYNSDELITNKLFWRIKDLLKYNIKSH